MTFSEKTSRINPKSSLLASSTVEQLKQKHTTKTYNQPARYRKH